MVTLTRDIILAGLRAAERLRMGEAPLQAELDNAPILSGWTVQPHGAGLEHLAGMVEGHPTLPDGFIRTSALLVLDPDLKWARTVSRIYILGQSLGDLLTSHDVP